MGKITLQDALIKQDLRYYKKSIDANIIEKFSENVHNSKVGKAEYMSGMREPDIVYNALPNTF